MRAPPASLPKCLRDVILLALRKGGAACQEHRFNRGHLLHHLLPLFLQLVLLATPACASDWTADAMVLLVSLIC